jgi:hypothetical protein
MPGNFRLKALPGATSQHSEKYVMLLHPLNRLCGVTSAIFIVSVLKKTDDCSKALV